MLWCALTSSDYIASRVYVVNKLGGSQSEHIRVLKMFGLATTGSIIAENQLEITSVMTLASQVKEPHNLASTYKVNTVCSCTCGRIGYGRKKWSDSHVTEGTSNIFDDLRNSIQYMYLSKQSAVDVLNSDG